MKTKGGFFEKSDFEKYPNIVLSQWVSRVLDFSTEYSQTWAANSVVGPPKNYPNYGDLRGSWASRSYRTELEFIEIQFKQVVDLQELHIYETFNPGAIVRIYCKEKNEELVETNFSQGGMEIFGESEGDDSGMKKEEWTLIWEGKQNNSIPKTSRIFKPRLSLDRKVFTKTIRIEQRLQGMDSWSEIDCVKMIGLRLVSAKYLPKLSRDLKTLFKEHFFHDIEFIDPRNKDRTPIKAHLGFLCARSEVFYAQFISCQMEESIEAQEKRVMKIELMEGVDSNVFELMVEFLYSNHVMLKIPDIIPLYVLADQYILVDLKEYLKKYLKMILSADNCLKIYEQLCRSMKENEGILNNLKGICLDFIAKHKDDTEEKNLQRKELMKVFKSIVREYNMV